MNQNSRAATAKFCYSQLANAASMQANGFFEVWSFGLMFFISTNGGCTCFYEEKTKIIASQSQYGRFLEDLFAVCPETAGLHLTQLHYLPKFSDVKISDV